MSVSLLGGPLDGTVSTGLSHLPLYMVATNLKDRPIYKRTSCTKCSWCKESVSYVFVGYENDSSAIADNATAAGDKIVFH